MARNSGPRWQQLAAGLGAGACLGSLLAAGVPLASQPWDVEKAENPADGASPPSLFRRHLSKDGTHFQASLGDTRALPDHFPDYLHLPQSSVVSSGHLQDREGSLTSLLLQTALPVQEIRAYYRRNLWGRGWEILSELEQADGIQTLVFESPRRPNQLLQQAVIQVGSLNQRQHRDILILLSTVFDPDTPRQQLPVKGWSKTPSFPPP